MNASNIIYSVLVMIFGVMLVGISFGMTNNVMMKCSTSYFGVIFGITKAISTLLSIALGALLMQPLIKYGRIFFAISRNTIQSIHTGLGMIFVILSITHVIINSYIMATFFRKENIVSTGVLLALVIAVMIVSSSTMGRAKHYTTFVVMHYTTMILTVILLPIHANYCYFKYDNGSCISSWYRVLMWLLPVFLVPFLTTMSKYIPWIRKNRLVISNVTVYPMKVIKIRLENVMRKLGGTTVYIGKGRFPIEWHPYTFVDDSTIVMKVRGDWTTDLARSLGVYDWMVTPTSYPELIYDGGFKNVKINCEAAVYIATGIGITTFVHHTRTNDLQNCFMIIVVKKLKELTWLWEIGLGGKVIVLLFITGKEERQLSRTLVDDLPEYVEQISFHRPDWRDTLKRLEERGVKRVYYAGIEGVNISKYTRMPVTEV